MDNKPSNQKLPTKPPLRISKEDFSQGSGSLKYFVGIIVFVLAVFTITYYAFVLTNKLEILFPVVILIAGVTYFVFFHIPNTKWGGERKAAKEKWEEEQRIHYETVRENFDKQQREWEENRSNTTIIDENATVRHSPKQEIVDEEQEALKKETAVRHANKLSRFFELYYNNQSCFKGLLEENTIPLNELKDGDYFFNGLTFSRWDISRINPSVSFVAYYQGEFINGSFNDADGLIRDIKTNLDLNEDSKWLKELLSFTHTCEDHKVFTDFVKKIEQEHYRDVSYIGFFSSFIFRLRCEEDAIFQENLTKAPNAVILKLAEEQSLCNTSPYSYFITKEFKERLELLKEIAEAKKVMLENHLEFKQDIVEMHSLLKGKQT